MFILVNILLRDNLNLRTGNFFRLCEIVLLFDKRTAQNFQQNTF